MSYSAHTPHEAHVMYADKPAGPYVRLSRDCLCEKVALLGHISATCSPHVLDVLHATIGMDGLIYLFAKVSTAASTSSHIRTYPLLPGMMHFLSHGRIPVPYCTLVTRCLPVTGLSGGGAGPAWSLPGGSAAAHPASHLQQPRSGEGVYCSEGNVNVGPLPAVSEDTSLTGCC